MWINGCEIAQEMPGRLMTKWEEMELSVGQDTVVLGGSPYLYYSAFKREPRPYYIVVDIGCLVEDYKIGDYVLIYYKDHLGMLRIKSGVTREFYVTNMSNITKLI